MAVCSFSFGNDCTAYLLWVAIGLHHYKLIERCAHEYQRSTLPLASCRYRAHNSESVCVPVVQYLGLRTYITITMFAVNRTQKCFDSLLKCMFACN